LSKVSTDLNIPLNATDNYANKLGPKRKVDTALRQGMFTYLWGCAVSKRVYTLHWNST